MPGIVGLGKAAELAAAQMPSRINIADAAARPPAQGTAAENRPRDGHRPPAESTARACQLLRGVHRGGSHADAAQQQGHRCFQRLGLHLAGAQGSHVLIALGLSHEIAQGSVLFTLGPGQHQRGYRLCSGDHAADRRQAAADVTALSINL